MNKKWLVITRFAWEHMLDLTECLVIENKCNVPGKVRNMRPYEEWSKCFLDNKAYINPENEKWHKVIKYLYEIIIKWYKNES